MLKKLALLLPFAFAIPPTSLAQSQLTGDWQGTLEANGTSFRIVWHVVANPDGTLASTFDNIDEGVYGIKNITTSLNGSDIAASVDDTIQINGQSVNIKGTFVGTVNTDATEVKGTWTQTDPEQPPAALTLKHTPAKGASTVATHSPLIGDWQGTLDAGGTSFHVAWHVVAAEDGSLISTLDNVDQGIFGIKTKATVLKGSDISMNVDDVIQANGQEINLKGTFEGKLNSDSTELTGTWTQTDPEQPPAPITLKHMPAKSASTVAAHP